MGLWVSVGVTVGNYGWNEYLYVGQGFAAKKPGWPPIREPATPGDA